MLNPGSAEVAGAAGGRAVLTRPPSTPRREPETRALLDLHDGVAGSEAPALEADRGRRPQTQAGRRSAPADGSLHAARTRCLALGGLTAIVAAVGTITAATLGTPRPPAPVAGKLAAAPRYWIARRGQSLISIAARESISPSAVGHANPSLVGRSLAAGQRVRLPN